MDVKKDVFGEEDFFPWELLFCFPPGFKVAGKACGVFFWVSLRFK